ncbi:MAG: sigma-70 family RNA polymerase sigma factor [Phycisphaerales bacterium]|nr:sigma-70 family RNA polymerase sigma factor [Phycisphaerales bacterium]
MSEHVHTPPDDDAALRQRMEDAGWVAAARKGDQAAFDRLVERYQRRAVSVAYRLLGNSEDARDAAQDAFLRAYRGLAKLEDPRRFGAWLMRIVTNLSLNMRRSRARSAGMSTDDLIEGEQELRTASGATLSTGLAGPELGELSDAVQDAIDSLPEKQRLALVLFSIEGLPQKEVAEIMNCTVQLVKWNVFQARKSLREMLADHLDD